MSDIASIDMAKLAPKVMDNILTANNSFCLFLLTNKPKDFQSFRINKGTKVKKSVSGNSFIGMDRFDVTYQDTLAQFAVDPAYYYQSIVLADTDVTQNSTDPNAAVNLVALKIEEGINDMIDSIGDIFYADGTGNGSKDFKGLKYIVDDGTVAGTFQGLSRTTYPKLKSFKTSVSTGNGLVATSTLASTNNGATIGGDTATHHFTTSALWTQYEALIPLVQQTQIASFGYAQFTRLGKTTPTVQALGGNAGLEALFWRGKPVIRDDKVPTGYWYMLNEKYIGWYGQQLKSASAGKYHSVDFAGNKEMEGLYADIDAKNVGLVMTDMKVPVDQAGSIGQVILGGQPISYAPNRHAYIIFT